MRNEYTASVVVSVVDYVILILNFFFGLGIIPDMSDHLLNI